MGIFDYEVIQIDGDYAHLSPRRYRREAGCITSALSTRWFADSSGIRAWTSGPGVCAAVFSSVNPADMPKIPGFSSAESGENP